MLVRLFGENFRSFRDPFELSMVAADLTNDQDKDRGFFEVHPEGLDEPLRLLRCVGIYGANASGKSTVMMAASALSWMVRHTVRESEPGDELPTYEPFALSKTCAEKPVRLGCTFISSNHLYEYQIAFDQNEIKHERLTKISDDTNILINRKENGDVDGHLIEGSKVLQQYVSDMQPNIAILSKLALLGPSEGPDSIVPIYQSLKSSLTSRNFINDNIHWGTYATTKKAHEDETFRVWMMDKLMRPADLGIIDILIQENLEDKDVSSREFRQLPFEVEFSHAGEQSNSISLSDESAGTRKIYNLAPYWHDLAMGKATLIADELSASLHPGLLGTLINAINENKNEENRSQLIFTCHDTGLLEGRDGGPAPLRRDQIYFTQKDKDGASSLFSLTEFKDEARKVHNIRKRYLSGRYGAIPMPEGISL